MKKPSFFAFLRLSAVLSLLAAALFAQTSVPAPRDVLGFTPGDDRKIASWAQTVEYFKKLDAASDRVMFEEIGRSTMGAPFVYAIISSPENLKNLAKYKEIQKKLAAPRLIKSDDKAAAALIKEGKTIVLITCGIHSTEVGSSLSSMLIAERLARGDDAETRKILDNTIVLLVPSLNPDGVDIVKNWYDKTLNTPFEGTNPPELYHKYTGHDNNRDWYAFTQIETRLTVDKIHNQWHPQIVHDIHQQGASGARMFLPPYLPPVEPNVPKQIVEGFTELGGYMAESLRKDGFAGITTASTYDAWTPARAYSHYHAGVRILSETASARLASPVNIKFEDLRGDLGYDAKKESPNFRPVWKGGQWRIGDITRYMTTAAFALLEHSSDHREKWLTRFYAIGKEAVRERKKGELWGFAFNGATEGGSYLERLLERGGVEIERNTPQGTLVKMAQPYGSFAKALLETQTYPNLKDESGTPIQPYDVTAHTLPLLFGVNVEALTGPPPVGSKPNPALADFDCLPREGFAIYKSSIPSMDEGWTRFVFDGYEKGRCFKMSSVRNKDIVEDNLGYRPTLSPSRPPPVPAKGEKAKPNLTPYRAIIFPDQSPNQMLNGYAKGTMPDEFTGGIGKDGAANLKKFVENGGTLVFLNRASDFAIREFGLPVKDVTEGLPRKEFFIPGSILRTEIDPTHPVAKGMPKESIAWFEDSPAFEIQTDPLALANDFRVIASYPKDPKKILLSGWAFGAERLAGKAALVEFRLGKGKIYLFGFRPQYRGQSLATFPLLFNAIAN